jgi:hypothetical protein
VAVKVMELKDVILSTLAEMDGDVIQEKIEVPQQGESEQAPELTQKDKEIEEISQPEYNGEEQWLQSVRERLLVLFEGFQSPNNVQIEAKVDLSLNFLEYLLATIDTRIETIKGKTE